MRTTLVLLGLTALCMCVSVVVLMSTFPSLAGRQLIFFIIALGTIYGVSRIPFRLLVATGWIWYSLLLLALIALQLLGQTTRNAASWFAIGDFIAIQPSQMALPIISLVISVLLASAKQISLTKLLLTLGILLAPLALIAAEPDLGTAVVVGSSLLSTLFIAPTRWAHLLGIALVSMVGVGALWTFSLQPYQQQRVLSFLGQGDANTNYQARQSLIAIGAGGLTGAGIGQGTQSYLRFLPERHNDFIFATFAEEFGFIGSVLLLCVFTGITWTIMHTLQRARLGYERYYLFSIACGFVVQVLVHVGMNSGLLPITGISLPLISYGGSSLLSFAFMLGTVGSIAIHTPAKIPVHLG
jgi:rod shape determining protein RodA